MDGEPITINADDAESESPEARMLRAGHVLADLRRRIVESMVDHILDNDDVFDAMNPDDRYNYWLLEIEEKYLARLGLIRRVMTEIQSLPGMAPSLRSRVHHVRVPLGQPLGQAIATAVDELGQVTIADIAIHDDDEGHDIFIVHHVSIRGNKNRKPISR